MQFFFFFFLSVACSYAVAKGYRDLAA